MNAVQSSMHIPLDFKQFDVALEAIMIEEEQSHKRLTLADHPVYGMLFDSTAQFADQPTHGVKMTTPVNHTPEVNIVTRVKGMAGMFDPTLSASEWQDICDHHPAAPFIIEELQAYVYVGKQTDGNWTYGDLTRVMDRLDAVGFLTSFDRSSLVFSITFKEHADIRLTDTQHDRKNKRLLDEINQVDPMENPKGGWADNKPTHTRVHPWSFTLNPPLPIEGGYSRSVPTVDGPVTPMLKRGGVLEGYIHDMNPITTPRT